MGAVLQRPRRAPACHKLTMHDLGSITSASCAWYSQISKVSEMALRLPSAPSETQSMQRKHRMPKASQRKQKGVHLKL